MQGRAKWEAKVIEAQTALDRARTGLSVCESEASEASQGVKDAHDRVDQAEAARVKARESAEVRGRCQKLSGWGNEGFGYLQDTAGFIG